MYTINEAIEKAKVIHGDKYDYSLVKFNKVTDKVIIICPKHGPFIQEMRIHYKGQGCPLCGVEARNEKNKDTNESFIEKSKKIWGDIFDYSKVNYVSSRTKVTLICPKHGEFKVEPNAHLANHRGCPICTKIKIHENYASNTAEFIKKAKIIHGDKYDYSKVDYTYSQKKVCIICPEHGEFWQTPDSHLNGKHGCPKCSNKKTSERQLLNTQKFIDKAKLIHGNKYLYDKTRYIDYKTPVCITCPLHGDFLQVPYYHLSGNGCQMCGVNTSKGEDEIYKFCSELLGEDKVLKNTRGVIPPFEIDVYIPSLKIGIEYNGIVWHSDKYKNKNYHLDKLNKCKEKGIKLIQVFEDEYTNNKKIVLSKIAHLLGVQNKLPKVMARKCIIREINKKIAKDFLDENHIQGYVSSTVYLGAYYQEKLTGVMLFKKEIKKSNNWELTRFASDNSLICQGIGGKLFKYFVNKFNPDEVKSFADRRWTVDEENNIYKKLGFIFDYYLQPEYRYFSPKDGLIRQHKFRFRKQKLHKKYGLPLTMTERQMTEKLGYFRIYDCGLIKYIWKKEPKI